ncbi:MAG: Glutathione synthetase [Alphaproteobacteria bacterium MarineAlpha9_Bin4]|nr:glutathione synthase [Pelagibacterales bacterium]PPR25376.1 MAG: Glutathione synthetase [Alphaproteobacteria bacterium MarineAlpha9_Bin4]
MNNLKVAVQMDAPELLDRNADSTIAIIEEALKRKYKVHIYSVDDLSLKDNDPIALCKEVKSLDIKNKDFLKLTAAKKKHLSTFNVILIRQDPPYNMKYLTATYILEKLSLRTRVLNDPLSIRNSPEKLLVTNFYKLMPPTLITKNKSEINDFLKVYKNCIIKPLYGNGGKNVFFCSRNDPNTNVIIEKFLEDNEHFIIQKFIKNVSKGDKRILLIDGSPVGAINRLPGKREIRANIHIGGKAEKTNLTKKDLSICSKIKNTLRDRNLFFAGIDVIDNYITEINVTSPTCIREINYFNKDNIAKKFWDSFEKKYLH